MRKEERVAGRRCEEGREGEVSKRSDISLTGPLTMPSNTCLSVF